MAGFADLAHPLLLVPALIHHFDLGKPTVSFLMILFRIYFFLVDNDEKMEAVLSRAHGPAKSIIIHYE